MVGHLVTKIGWNRHEHEQNAHQHTEYQNESINNDANNTSSSDHAELFKFFLQLCRFAFKDDGDTFVAIAIGIGSFVCGNACWYEYDGLPLGDSSRAALYFEGAVRQLRAAMTGKPPVLVDDTEESYNNDDDVRYNSLVSTLSLLIDTATGPLLNETIDASSLGDRISLCGEIVSETTAVADPHDSSSKRLLELLSTVVSGIMEACGNIGDDSNCVVLAFWNHRISDAMAPNGPVGSSFWDLATASTCLTDVGAFGIAKKVIDHIRSTDVHQTNPYEDALVGTESRTISSRLATIRSVPNPDDPQGEQSALDELLRVIDMSEPEASEVLSIHDSKVLRSWVLSSVWLARLQLALVDGIASDVIDSAKRCIRLCTDSLKRLGSGREVGRPSSFVHRTTLSYRFLSRQIQCLLALSDFYDSVGNYKKAESYTVSAKSLCLRNHHTGTHLTKATLHDALRMGNEHHPLLLSCVQRQCRLMGKKMYIDDVESAIRHWFDERPPIENDTECAVSLQLARTRLVQECESCRYIAFAFVCRLYDYVSTDTPH